MKAVEKAVQALRDRFPTAAVVRDSLAKDSLDRVGHLLWMCEEIPRIIDKGISYSHREKAMRWLGFVQGAMWAMDIRGVEAMRKDNTSDGLGPYPIQVGWNRFVKRCGSEQAAKEELARQLRRAAEIVLEPGYPDVFGCEVWDGPEPCAGDNFMDTVSVTLSNLWPG